MNLLITGANGFVGQYVCALALKRDYRTVAIARAWRRVAASPNERLLEVDLTKTIDIPLAGVFPDVIIHLAGRAHRLRDDAPDPLAEFRRVNRDATLALARWAAAVGVKRFVYVSSIGVNGNASRPGTVLTEKSPVSPHDFYAISKLEAEIGLQALASDSGMEFCIVRPPLVYGAGAPGNFQRLVKLVRLGLPLPFASVRNRRSLIYVQNLADALLECAISRHAANQIFVVSDGCTISTPELLQIIGTAVGRKVRLFPFPLALLRHALLAIRAASLLDKLTNSLEVDDSHIRKTLLWHPPVPLRDAFNETFNGLSASR